MIRLEVAQALFERALKAEIGIYVKVDEPKLYSLDLWRCREELGDPRYSNLTFLLPAGNEEVYICRKDTEAP